ncbi:hypothetical protein [Neorhodopirellula lusitana]|nr:hypothetical protein [Neorhodopirellula lusitana]
MNSRQPNSRGQDRRDPESSRNPQLQLGLTIMCGREGSVENASVLPQSRWICNLGGRPQNSDSDGLRTD